MSVDAPGLWEVAVVWMVENGDVSPVVPSFYIHANINPDRAFAFGLAIFLEGGIQRFSFRFAATPGHAEEETAVLPLADGDFSFGGSLPGEVEDALLI